MMNEMYTINVDYLEFRCQDKSGYISNFVSNTPNRLYIISPTVKLVKTSDFKYYSRWFLKCFDILINNEKIGFLYTDPLRNSYYSVNEIISIRIDNQVLYRPDINLILRQVIDELQLTPKSITRLDIAYDTDKDLLKRFKRLYNQIGRYTYKNRGKTTVNGTGVYDTQINIGSLRSQGKTVIIYDKSTLLRQQSKAYLDGLYKTVFGEKDVYRVEVRVTSKTTGKYDIELYKLGDKGYLESLFEDLGGSLLDFRYKPSNRNTTRQDKIKFVDLNRTGVELIKKLSVRTIKGDNSMKYLIWKLHCDKDRPEFSSISKEIRQVMGLYVEMTGLKDWLRKKEMKEK
jgi:hypothetical protein